MNISDNQDEQQKKDQGFWRPANIIVLSILAIIIAGGVYFIFAYTSAVPKIIIQSEHQQCSIDDDCTMVMTKCSCDCGTAVNKEYVDDYSKKVDNACEHYSGMMCSMICNYKVTCDSGVCTKHEVVPAVHEIQEIKLVINAPFFSETIRLDTSGKVYYFTTNEIDDTEEQDQKRIEVEDYVELADFIEQSSFYSLEESYMEKDLMDATAYTISVSKQNQIQPITVSCYGQCPEDAVQIRQQILELWGEDIMNIGV